MKKSFSFLFALASLVYLTSCGSNGDNNGSSDAGSASSENSNGKYPIKSGIVKTKMSAPMMGGDIYDELYFDAWGAQEKHKSVASISMLGQNIETVSYTMMKDGWIYSWTEGQNTGSKMKPQDMDEMADMNFDKMSKEMMDDLGIKKIGTETIKGKSCDKYEMHKDGMGDGTFWVWKNIPMRSEMSMGGVSMTSEVESIQENVNHASGTFDLPADVIFSEMGGTDQM
ncbi:MAG: hypothetical protein R2794_02360 [Chitinophagales bacterium]